MSVFPHAHESDRLFIATIRETGVCRCWRFCIFLPRGKHYRFFSSIEFICQIVFYTLLLPYAELSSGGVVFFKITILMINVAKASQPW